MSIMMKKIVLFAVVFLMSMLCMAVATQEQWVYDEQLNDNLIAMGIPSKPNLNNSMLNNAIVLVGEQRSYLAYSDDNFPNLYEQLAKTDIRYLKIMTANQRHSQIGNDYVEVMSDDDSNLRIQLSFYKPANHFNSENERMAEYEKMEDLGFWCVTETEKIGKDLSCFDFTTLNVQVIDVSNKDQLEHKFNVLLPIKFLYYNGNYDETKHRQLTSLNSAMTLNIKTLPIQADTDTPK